MADILIRGMEMPKTCSQCPMSQDYVMCKLNSFAFWNTNNPFDFRNERLAGCPLVELPPHGDLIDADAFCRNIFNGTGDPFIKAGVMAHVKAAPTIVPASKEETE